MLTTGCVLHSHLWIVRPNTIVRIFEYSNLLTALQNVCRIARHCNTFVQCRCLREQINDKGNKHKRCNNTASYMNIFEKARHAPVSWALAISTSLVAELGLRLDVHLYCLVNIQYNIQCNIQRLFVCQWVCKSIRCLEREPARLNVAQSRLDETGSTVHGFAGCSTVSYAPEAGHAGSSVVVTARRRRQSILGVVSHTRRLVVLVEIRLERKRLATALARIQLER